MRQKVLFDTPNNIKERFLEIIEEKRNLEIELLELRKICKHENTTKKFDMSSGNYDPTCDREWYDITCSDCGERWRHDKEQKCPECGKWHTDAVKWCDMVYGARGWRQLGVYDG